MKYTKKQREYAANQLSCLACQAEWEMDSNDIDSELARCVLRDCWPEIAPYPWADGDWRVAYAKAEAMIRTGWSPS